MHLRASAGVPLAGEYPDFVTLPKGRNRFASAGVGCAGGGTLRAFAGFTYPFLHQNFTNSQKTRVIAVEPASCPSMTRGKYLFDYGDEAGTAPIVPPMACTRWATPSSRPPKVHAGGLRYHGMAPSVSALVEHGDVEARAVKQLATFEAAVQF